MASAGASCQMSHIPCWEEHDTDTGDSVFIIGSGWGNFYMFTNKLCIMLSSVVCSSTLHPNLLYMVLDASSVIPEVTLAGSQGYLSLMTSNHPNWAVYSPESPITSCASFTKWYPYFSMQHFILGLWIAHLHRITTYYYNLLDIRICVYIYKYVCLCEFITYMHHRIVQKLKHRR